MQTRQHKGSSNYVVARCKERWQDRIFVGKFSFGPLTIFGSEGMHWAIDLSTPWGYLCVHPTTWTRGRRWPWYIYLSQDGTPQGATWGFGPGFKHTSEAGRRAKYVDAKRTAGAWRIFNPSCESNDVH